MTAPALAGDNVLEVRDLHVRIGQSQILHGLSFDVPSGGITGLLGRNGVGKSTTLRGILGLVNRSGEIGFEGRAIGTLRTPEIVRRGIAYVPEDRDIFSQLTVEENLRLAERPNNTLRYDLIYDLFPEMKTRGTQRAGTLSGGQQQMLAISRALLNAGNRLLLVDEPTKGLSPLVVRNVVDALKRASEVVTILLVEQNLSVAHKLARDAIVLDQGRVGYIGTVDALMSDPALARHHLGLRPTGTDH